MRYIKLYESFDKYKIVVKKTNAMINIIWIDESKEVEKVGVFDFFIRNGEAVIMGYVKYDKTINGYPYIKKSIDNVLSLGYNVVSNGNRSDSALKVWDKLSKEYKVVDEDPNNKRNGIKKIISEKREL
jgi:hypothetical protein